MFMSMLIVYYLFHKRSKFLRKFCCEIICTGIVGGKIAKYRNTSKVLPQPKQNLLFAKLIRLSLHVYNIPHVRGVPKGLKNFPTVA